MRLRIARMALAGAAVCGGLTACYLDGGTGTSAGNTVTKNDGLPKDPGHGDGTGTGAGNTLTARVLTLDGAPAAGAQVTLRPAGLLPDSMGAIPSLENLIRRDTADAQGRVGFAADTGYYVLESVRGAGGNRQVAWRESIRLGKGDTVSLGDVGMASAATLKGHVRINPSDVSGIASGALWAGFPGTGVFSRIGSDGNFALDGLPPGARDLHVFRNLVLNKWQRVRVRGWSLTAGNASLLDSLVLPAPPPDGAQVNSLSDTSVSVNASACLEEAVSLRREDYAGPSRTPLHRVLRSWMTGPQPAWIELDPCLGTWRKLADMPADVGVAIVSYSAENFDVVQASNKQVAYWLDSLGNTVASVHSPNVVETEYYRGRFYVIRPAEQKVKVFEAYQDIAGNKAVDSLDVGLPYATLWDIAIEDSVLYFAGGASPAIQGGLLFHRYDLRTRAKLPPAALADYGGSLYGTVSAGPGRLWLAESGGYIRLIRCETGPSLNPMMVTEARIKVEGAESLSTLSRIRPTGMFENPLFVGVPTYNPVAPAGPLQRANP